MAELLYDEDADKLVYEVLAVPNFELWPLTAHETESLEKA